MPFVSRENVRIHYVDEGAGPAILFTHGFTSTHRMWQPQVDALRDRYRIIRWDMRGHGDSDAPDDPAAYSHDLTVADMAAVLDACGVRRAVVAGLSLGGYMSMLFYATFPARVSALLLFDTGPGYRSESARETWNRYAEENARAIEDRGADGLIRSPEICAEHHRTLDGLVHVARGMLTQRDARVIDGLTAIDVPTLLMIGAEDEAFLEGMGYMSRKIGRSRYEIVEGAGHAVNMDRPEAVNRTLSDFLRRHTARESL